MKTSALTLDVRICWIETNAILLQVEPSIPNEALTFESLENNFRFFSLTRWGFHQGKRRRCLHGNRLRTFSGFENMP